MSAGDEQIHHRTCNLCEAACGLAIRHRGDEILAVTGDEASVLSRGYICPKGVAIADVQSDPDRLRQPLKRTPEGWREISWDEAFDEVATQLRLVRSRGGADAVALYTGNPVAHSHGSLLLNDAFLKALGTTSLFSAVSCDGLPHMLAAYQMFGHFLSNPVPDLDHTHYLLCLGANPVVSNGSFFSAPDIRRRLRDLRSRGGKFVLVDPRRTESAVMADEHHFIRPGTDTALLLAILHVIFEEGLDKLGCATGHVRNLEALKAAVRILTLEQSSLACGISAEAIRQIAREFARAPAAVAYGRMGVATSHAGSLNAWLLYALNVVTGNLDSAGGAMFTAPVVDIVGLTGALGKRGSFGTRRSRVRGLPEFCGEYPAAALAEEILAPGPGQIRALIVHAGNPVLSIPQGGELERALASLDFMVSIDMYLNETSRHANLILPPTGPLERSSFPLTMNAISVRNVARYAPPLFAPSPDRRHDWQILAELTTRLSAHHVLGKRRAERRLRQLYERGDAGLLDGLIRWGPYGAGPSWLPRSNASTLSGFICKGVGAVALASVRQLAALNKRLHGLVQASALGTIRTHLPENQARRLDLQALLEQPHGIDLGPLLPMLAQRIFHPDGKIDLAPALFVSALPAQTAELLRRNSPSANNALTLVGRRHLTSNNSWMHNIARLNKGPIRCTLLISKMDAMRMNLRDGQMVRIEQGGRSISLPAEVSDEMMVGVASMPHGWGHHRPGCRQTVASSRPGESMNDLLDATSIDSLSGMSILNGVEVRLTPIE